MKLISGGQTGADRAALDVALELGLDHGGWVPKGRAAEDGPLPDRYRVRETPSEDRAERTERNVADVEATLLVGGQGRSAPGSHGHGCSLNEAAARRTGRASRRSSTCPRR